MIIKDKYKKYVLIFSLIVFFISFSVCIFKKTENYNVVLIVIDTVRADHLPFYGYKENTTPFLNKLSKSSIIFHHTFSSSSWTAPATASIFTSVYPFQHGVLMCLLAIKRAKRIDPNVTVNRIPEEIKTLPEVLKENGYKTFGISDNLNVGEIEGFTQGFDKFETYGYRKAPFIVERILRWKKEILSSRKYFLYIHFMDPHAPYHKRFPWYKQKNDFKRDMIARYDSEISFVDSYIKKLYREFGWDKNTIFIVTSDHGEGLWDHGHMDHGQSLFLEEIRVPLLISFPKVKRRLTIYKNVSTIDILPTIADILGIRINYKDYEGKSLFPLIKRKRTEDRYLLSYLWKKIDKEREFKAVIFKKYHFIINDKGRRFLYNMSNDKKERRNIVKKYSEKAKRMERFFTNFLINSRKYKKTKNKIHLNTEEIKKLKSLGYVQ